MPPAENSGKEEAPTLVELAEKRLHPLSRAERELFEAVTDGRQAVALFDGDDDPIKSDKWIRDRVVRGVCFAWLCTDRQATELVTSRGIEFHGMRVEGDVDLRHANVEFPISAERCAFLGTLLLQRAQLGGLYLSNCHLAAHPERQGSKALDAEEARIGGGLWLRGACLVEGELSLLGTRVSAELDCTNARFSQHAGFTADGLRIEGDVLLIGSTFGGAVRFLGAANQRDLNCERSRFSERQDNAFNADGIKVGGDVLLYDVEARGSASLYAATIGGNLDCSESRFLQTDDALQAEEANIAGNVLLNEFAAHGGVNFARSKIGGNLECVDAQFLHEADAIMADGAKIEGEVTFGAEADNDCESFLANGEVRLFDVKISGHLNCSCAHFLHHQGALYVDGAQIGGDVRFSRVRAEGRVGFPGATIAGDVDLADTYFERKELDGPRTEDDDTAAFTAEGASVNGSFFFVESEVHGLVTLIGATIKGDLQFRGGNFQAIDGAAISALRTRIGGDLMFVDAFGAKGEVAFEAKGEVAFGGAVIGGDVKCKKAKFSNDSEAALSMEGAKVQRSLTLDEGLEIEGGFSLENAEVDRCLDLRGLGASKNTRLNLRSAIAGLVQDDVAHWGLMGGLELDGFTYERFHAEGAVTSDTWKKWVRQQRSDRFVPQPYEQLATVLRRMGYERYAKRVMIAKNKDQARFLRITQQSWWWYNFFGRAIGYGYAPWRAFVASMVFIISGYVLFAVGASSVMSPTKDSAYERDSKGAFVVDAGGNRTLSREYPSFNPFFYSLESFAPLLKLDQSANWAPNADATRFVPLGRCLHLTGGFLRGYLYCHIILGWLLTSLWIGAVTGLVKT